MLNNSPQSNIKEERSSYYVTQNFGAYDIYWQNIHWKLLSGLFTVTFFTLFWDPNILKNAKIQNFTTFNAKIARSGFFDKFLYLRNPIYCFHSHLCHEWQLSHIGIPQYWHCGMEEIFSVKSLFLIIEFSLWSGVLIDVYLFVLPESRN